MRRSDSKQLNEDADTADFSAVIKEVRDSLGVIRDSIGAPPPRFLTVGHAAEYADLSQESIRRMIAARKLTALRRSRVLCAQREAWANVVALVNYGG